MLRELLGHEPIKLRWPVASLAPSAPRWSHEPQFLHFPAKVTAVELSSEDCLAQRLQFAEGKLPGQQLETNRHFSEPVAQMIERHLQQFRMIEWQQRQLARAAH